RRSPPPARLPRRLPRGAPTAAVPAAAATPVIVDAAPVPLLQLSKIALPGAETGSEAVDVARLSFLYRDAAVDPEDERQFAKVEPEPGATLFVRRDRPREA